MKNIILSSRLRVDPFKSLQGLFEPNPFSTHLPVLKMIVKHFRPESVWEFGMGLYSTTLFVNHCREVISVEMQDEEWYRRVSNEIRKTNFEPLLMLGPQRACDFLHSAERRFDLIFVDGHGDSRYTAVNVSFDKTDLIVVHDTETPLYHWERIQVPEDWFWIDFKRYKPWSSVLIKGRVQFERMYRLGARFKPAANK